MQADEQIRVMRFGEHDAICIGNVHVTGARQKHLPALLFQQRRQPFCPVKREFFFKPAVQNAVGAEIRRRRGRDQSQ